MGKAQGLVGPNTKSYVQILMLDITNINFAQLVFLFGAIKHQGFQIDYNVIHHLTYIILTLTFR